MIRKFFPLDKNYLLKEAQASVRDLLLRSLLERTKSEYLNRYNPLGLEDKLSLRIKNFEPRTLTTLYNLYETLAGVYRYRFGRNQLEILWDGSDHREKYQKDWSESFHGWITDFCKYELFINAVLDVTVFFIENRNALLTENRMNNFMLQFFELRIQKKQGIVEAA